MKPDPEVKEYIEQFPPEFRAILYRLRELIFEVVPEAEEAIKWRMPTFSYLKKQICYIAGFKNHVTFAFHDGTMIKDPGGMFQGSGKYMRFVRYKSLEDMDEERIKIWILEGFYS